MCTQVLEALQDGASHDALVSVAGYVLGEYGRLVPEVPSHVQFALLHERFLTVSNETKVGRVCLSVLSLPIMAQTSSQFLSWYLLRFVAPMKLSRRACLQGLLLTAYLKFLIADSGDANLKALAEDVFNKYSRCNLLQCAAYSVMLRARGKEILTRTALWTVPVKIDISVPP